MNRHLSCKSVQEAHYYMEKAFSEEETISIIVQ